MIRNSAWMRMILIRLPERGSSSSALARRPWTSGGRGRAPRPTGVRTSAKPYSNFSPAVPEIRPTGSPTSAQPYPNSDESMDTPMELEGCFDAKKSPWSV